MAILRIFKDILIFPFPLKNNTPLYHKKPRYQSLIFIGLKNKERAADLLADNEFDDI